MPSNRPPPIPPPSAQAITMHPAMPMKSGVKGVSARSNCNRHMLLSYAPIFPSRGTLKKRQRPFPSPESPQFLHDKSKHKRAW